MSVTIGRVGWIAAGVLGIALFGSGCSRPKEDVSQQNAPATESVESESAAPPAQAGTSAGGGPLVFSGSDTMWNASPSLGEPAATFGDAPLWSETSVAAANRGTSGAPATVVGEVVDVSCYLQLGKRGEKHIPCGTDCVRNGAPIGVVDAGNRLYVVMAEEHDPRRYGNIALKEAMLPFMARTVEVTGMLTEREGMMTLYVRGYTVGENPNQPKGE